MSVIKVNNITNRDGTSGPVIAGIATVSSTSHMVVPSGNTSQRFTIPYGYITDGLFAHFDAANYEEFAGISTTNGKLIWPNASDEVGLDAMAPSGLFPTNSSRGGTTAGVSTSLADWSSTNGGIFTFNGTTHYFIIDSIHNSTYLPSGTGWTISAFFKSTTDAGISALSNNMISLHDTSGNNSLRFGPGGSTSGGFAVAQSGSGDTIVDSGYNYSDGNWFNVCVTRAVGNTNADAGKLYRNAGLVTSFTLGSTWQNQGLASIGQEWDAHQNLPSDFFTGSVGVISFYNRELTADEVFANFNAYKTRFGL